MMEGMSLDRVTAYISRNVPFVVKFSSFFLGVISPYPKRQTLNDGTYNLLFETRWRRKLFWFSTTFLILLFSGTLYTTVWYAVQFFGQTAHFLHFASFLLAFWAPLVCCQIISILALTKNCLNEYQHGRAFDWHYVFNEFTLAKKVFGLSRPLPMTSVRVVAVLFYSFVSLNIVLEIVLLCFQPCVSVLMCIRLLTIIGSLLFYSTYCYYLYLQRHLLQIQIKDTLSFIRDNVNNLQQCMERISALFLHYYQLKKVLQPWLIFVLFAVALGISVYITRFYKDVKAVVWSNVTESGITPIISFQPPFGDPVPICDDDGEATQTEDQWIVFNVIEVSEVIMIALFTFMAVGGLDFQVQWSNFRLALIVQLVCEDDRIRQSLLKFVKNFDPFKSNNTAINFVLPFLGLVFVLLSNGSLDF